MNNNITKDKNNIIFYNFCYFRCIIRYVSSIMKSAVLYFYYICFNVYIYFWVCHLTVIETFTLQIICCT